MSTTITAAGRPGTRQQAEGSATDDAATNCKRHRDEVLGLIFFAEKNLVELEFPSLQHVRHAEENHQSA
jgi:hypothetical protein